MEYPDLIKNLIDQFSKLPSLGPKSAERIVFYLLKQSKDDLKKLTKNIENLKDEIKICQICFNISTKSPCLICTNRQRNRSTICVVSYPQDVLVIEKTGEYNGLYHVLQGVLNPIEGITPEKLRIKELINRIKKDGIKEIIIATNPDLEGESTAMYLTRQLKPMKVKVTRLAKGLPVGADLEYADEITVSNALKGRREV